MEDDKLFNELFESLVNVDGSYKDDDLDRDKKYQEKVQDVTGNFEFWGIT